MIKVATNTTQTTGSISSAAQGAAIKMPRSTRTLSATVTTTGSGTGTVQWQASNDGTNWANYGTAATISGAGTVGTEVTTVTYLQYRLSYTVTGTYSASAVIVTKGDDL